MSDLISRQAALDMAITIQTDDFSGNETIEVVSVDDIKALPSVEPERKTGKWINGKCNRCGTNAPFWAMATTYYCSEYCPKCGAKMIEPRESEDV